MHGRNSRFSSQVRMSVFVWVSSLRADPSQWTIASSAYLSAQPAALRQWLTRVGQASSDVWAYMVVGVGLHALSTIPCLHIRSTPAFANVVVCLFSKIGLSSSWSVVVSATCALNDCVSMSSYSTSY